VSTPVVQIAPRLRPEAKELWYALWEFMTRKGRLRHVKQGTVQEELLRVFCGQLVYGQQATPYQVGMDLTSTGWPDHDEYIAARDRLVKALNEFHAPGLETERRGGA
jgi:hypothetical protein